MLESGDRMVNMTVSGIQGEVDSCLQRETDYEPTNKEMDAEVLE